MASSQAIREAALALPTEERAELIDALLASFSEQESAAIENAWIDECERRRKAIESGEMGTVDGEEVLRKLERGERP